MWFVTPWAKSEKALKLVQSLIMHHLPFYLVYLRISCIMKTFLGLQSFIALYGCCALGQNTIDIKLKTGTFRGLSTSNGTEKWLGIPFALPPIGQLRFKAPIPITKASSSIMDASTFGNACPQPAATLGASIAEDCLFLNVKIQSSFSNVLKPIPTRSGGRRGSRKGPNCLYSFGYTQVLDLNSLPALTIREHNREAPIPVGKTCCRKQSYQT